MIGKNLDQPANARWVPTSDLAPNEIRGGQTKQFGTLHDAIIFVMETLTPGDRGVAMIATDDDSLQIDEIESLCRQLKR